MADEREVEDPGAKAADKHGRRPFGKGMTSPDSTQVPLKAETGEPDYDAINGRIQPDEENKDQSR